MKVKQTFFQFFMYLVVGGLATIVEWGFFLFLNSFCGLYYQLATTLAFVASTAANWFFGRLILFHPMKQNTIKELLKIYVVSIIGLLMNLIIMYVAIELIGLKALYSKIIATGIVFIWNFLIRKIVIYKI